MFVRMISQQLFFEDSKLERSAYFPLCQCVMSIRVTNEKRKNFFYVVGCLQKEYQDIHTHLNSRSCKFEEALHTIFQTRWNAGRRSLVTVTFGELAEVVMDRSQMYDIGMMKKAS